MGLETRSNRQYYYRKIRIGRTVRSIYTGAGDLAISLAQLAALDRQRTAQEAANRRKTREAEQARERGASELTAQAFGLGHATLLLAGWRQHKRQWRRRRYPMTQAKPTAELRTSYNALPRLPEPGDYSDDAACAIFARCNHQLASEQDVAALRRLLAARFDTLTNSNGQLRVPLDVEVRSYELSPPDREFLRADLAARRRALGYADAPALERPLIDHLLLCELRLNVIEQQYTAIWKPGSVPLERARFWEQRLNAAQRRYLAAVEMLAKLRRVRVELARLYPDGSGEAVAVERPGR